MSLEEIKTPGQKTMTIKEFMEKEENRSLLAEIALRKLSMDKIMDELKKEGVIIKNRQAVKKALESLFPGKYELYKKAKHYLRGLYKEYDREFILDRYNINPLFYDKYLSGSDGIVIGPKHPDGKYSIYPLPLHKDREKSGGITFVRKGDFGWYKINPNNPKERYKVTTQAKLHTGKFSDGTPLMKGIDYYEPSVKESLIRGIMKDYKASVKTQYKNLIEKKAKEYVLKKYGELSKEEMERLVSLKKRELNRKYKKKIEKLTSDEAARKKAIDVIKNSEMDFVTFKHFGSDILRKNLDPVYASKSKSDRGKQRMIAEKDSMFSRPTLNIPFLTYSPPKRASMLAHELAKSNVFPVIYKRKRYFVPHHKLLKPEKPKVKAKFNDVEGVNLNTRFPMTFEENILTKEGAMIITEGAAKKFTYISSTPLKTLIVEDEKDLRPATRLSKPLTTIEEYEKIIKDPSIYFKKGDRRKLVLKEFPFMKNSPLYESPSEGYLVYVGSPRKKNGKKYNKRINGKDYEYIKQKYQVVRVSPLKLGDKILIRGGLKGVVTKIVPDGSLGVNPKTGEPYEIVINHEDVWKESKNKIKDKRYELSAKKRGALVKEYEAGKGKLFYILGGKFTAEKAFKSTSGLKMSWTFLAGLVEKIKGDKYVIETMTPKEEEKLIKKYKPPNGSYVKLPHTYAGHKYEYVYVPEWITQTYFDGDQLQLIFNKGIQDEFSSQLAYRLISTIAKKHFNPLPIYKNRILNLVTVSHDNPNELVMAASDLLKLGLNPKEKNYVTIRKEPVTSGNSIITMPVKTDWKNEHEGVIGIHPSIAGKATIDYDGDDVVVMVPHLPMKYFNLKLTEEDKKELKEEEELFKKNPRIFDMKYWESLARKAKNKDDKQFAIELAKYNEEVFNADNQEIGQLGGLRKRSLFAYGEKMKKYKVKDIEDREHKVTPKLINDCTNVEKVMKSHESKMLVGRFAEEIENYKKGEKIMGEYTKKDLEGEFKDIYNALNAYKLRSELAKILNKVPRSQVSNLLKEEEFALKEFAIGGGRIPQKIELNPDLFIDRVVIERIKDLGITQR